MKTTKKWGKMLLAGMAAMALAFGLVLAGCGDGNDSGKAGAYDGTYINADEDSKLVISGSNFTMSQGYGSNWVDMAKGTFAVSGTTATITVTHSYDGSGMVALPTPQTSTGTISADGRTITAQGEDYTKQ